MTAPREDWWLIVKRDNAIHCWHLGDSDPQRTADAIERARTLLGFPPGDGWVDAAERRNSVQLTPGEPHPSVMATATVHQMSDLDRVTAEQLTAYRAAVLAATSGARMQTARDAVARLTDAERASLRDEMPPRGTATTGGR